MGQSQTFQIQILHHQLSTGSTSFFPFGYRKNWHRAVKIVLSTQWFHLDICFSPKQCTHTVIPRERKERSIDMDTVLHHIYVPFQLALAAAKFPHLPVWKNISHETIAPGPPFGKFPLTSTPGFSSCGTRGSFVALPILEYCSGMARAGRRTLSSPRQAWHVLHIATAYAGIRKKN